MASSLAKKLAGEPVSKVELSVRCNNLMDKDLMSKSDPICVLYVSTSGKPFVEVGRTEQIKNDLNPVFSKTFNVDYYFEETQKLRFLIYDIDNATYRLDDDDFLGSMECSLGEVVSSSPLIRPLILKNNKTAGKSTISVTATELSTHHDILLLHFRAKNLDDKDFFGKSDPYLEFHSMTKGSSYRLVHRTEVVNNNLNPNWRPFEISSAKLCANDYTDIIKVECYDHDNDGSHDFIGGFETSVQQLMEATTRMVEWDCVNPKKKAKKKNYKNSGVVCLQSCSVSKSFSFLDFILGGLQINFTVGIDFTASNGDPLSNFQSLHSLQHPPSNQYLRAIQSVGAVIQDYDSDKMFPALGYGARIPPDMSVSHCFPLNFNQASPFCPGIQGILDAYSACLRSVKLYGPTNFAPIIHHVGQFAVQAQSQTGAKFYYVLLIITDGAISDLDDTISAIIHYSTSPLSIIIVGVGNADFQSMDLLDSDAGLLKDRVGNQARRDIVQFVPFNQFANSDLAALAKQVLAEIPSQVVGYFRLSKIEPSKPGPEQQQHQQQQPQGPYFDPSRPQQQHTPPTHYPPQQYPSQQHPPQQYPPQQQPPQQQPPQQHPPQQRPPQQYPPQYPLQQQPYPPQQQQYSPQQQQYSPQQQQYSPQQQRYPPPQHQVIPPNVYQTAQTLYPSLPPQNPHLPPNHSPNQPPYPQPGQPPYPGHAPYPTPAYPQTSPTNPNYPPPYPQAQPPRP